MTELTWPQRLAFAESEKRLRGLELPLPVTQQISYTAAMEEAPKRPRLKTPEDELEYRKLYADELVRAGVARTFGAKVSGAPSRAKRTAGTRVELVLSPAEHARYTALAEAEGLALSDVLRELLERWAKR